MLLQKFEFILYMLGNHWRFGSQQVARSDLHFRKTWVPCGAPTTDRETGAKETVWGAMASDRLGEGGQVCARPVWTGVGRREWIWETFMR